MHERPPLRTPVFGLRKVTEVQFRDLRIGDREVAAHIAASAAHARPFYRSLVGGDEATRQQRLEIVFRALLSSLDRPGVAIDRGGTLLGLAIFSRPGGCRHPAAPSSLASGLTELPIAVATRVLGWLDAWRASDPAEPHFHLGMLAVQRSKHGQGIGGRLMQTFLDEVDSERGVAYVEADSLDLVAYGQRFGFEIAHEVRVLGATTWLMRRGSIG